jgi:hypothetical protein
MRRSLRRFHPVRRPLRTSRCPSHPSRYKRTGGSRDTPPRRFCATSRRRSCQVRVTISNRVISSPTIVFLHVAWGLWRQRLCGRSGLAVTGRTPPAVGSGGRAPLEGGHAEVVAIRRTPRDARKSLVESSRASRLDDVDLLTRSNVRRARTNVDPPTRMRWGVSSEVDSIRNRPRGPAGTVRARRAGKPLLLERSRARVRTRTRARTFTRR